jgi:ribonucleoside-triphosphate reductase
VSQNGKTSGFWKKSNFFQKNSVKRLTEAQKDATYSVSYLEKNMESTRTLADIDRDIAQVKAKLRNVKGSETEVYARIVGYYRSVRNWNNGKKDEFKQRKEFFMPGEGREKKAAPAAEERPHSPSFSAMAEMLGKKITSYEFYSRKTCPNCPAVRDYLASCSIKGKTIDVDTDEGFAAAQNKGVCAAPTVILYGADGREAARACSKRDLAVLVPQEAVAV